MIRLADIHKTYQMGNVEVRALRGISLSINPGEFVAVMGPSGSGKSTLLHTLGLLDVPNKGTYRFAGQEVSDFNEDERAAFRTRTVGFVFQQFNLLARTSATENVALPLIYSGLGLKGVDPRHFLKEVGLESRTEHKPNELSGGQQQRVAIARALVNSPLVILADEPTGNLDTASTRGIMDVLTKLNKRGITLIVVTHEAEVATRARRIIHMRDGTIEKDERLAPDGRTDDGKLKQPVMAPSVSHRKPALFQFMEMRAILRQVGRALMSNKVRTALSTLGVLIGVAAVIAMMALGRGARRSVEEQVASLGSNLLVLRPGARHAQGIALEAGTITRLTLDDAGAILETVPSVKRVASCVSGGGQAVYGGSNWRSRVLGTNPTYASMRAYKPVSGRFFTDNEVRKRARVALLGRTVVSELFGEQNPVGEFIKINRIRFQVIGVLPEKGASMRGDEDDIIIIPVSTAMRRLLGKIYLDAIEMEVNSAAQLEQAQKKVKDLIMSRHRLQEGQEDSFQILDMAEIQAALSETSSTMAWLLASIAAISLLVGGIGIMNIMLVSVTERTREIGIRKAVGARRRDILTQFLIEALVVSIAGGSVGVCLGWVITWGMSNLAGWVVVVDLDTVLVAFSFSAAIGIIFGLWPARKASLLNPIDALRYE